jgi:hypothetical protein
VQLLASCQHLWHEFAAVNQQGSGLPQPALPLDVFSRPGSNPMRQYQSG